MGLNERLGELLMIISTVTGIVSLSVWLFAGIILRKMPL